MPITLNNSNISVTYNTGSNYIIETVKSDMYVRGTTSGNLSFEPTVSPSIHSEIIIEAFTYSGTGNTKDYPYNFSRDTICDILIVGGGGGGGYDRAAGGGAGGLLLYTNILVNTGSYTIKVGKGGVGATAYGSRPNDTGNGFSSSIEGLSGATALGGGRGGTSGNETGDFPKSGGSGGGGAGNYGWTTNTGALGTSGQGYKGGDMTVTSGSFNTAGGGGAGGNGGNGLTGVNPANSGNGGIGRDMSSYFGTSFGQSGWFAGGGGGSIDYGSTGSAAVSTTSRGGQGGGGNAGLSRGQNGSNGLSGTGGGGGGGANVPQGSGGSGGSGIVIIRYRSLAAAPTSVNMVKTLNFNYYSSLSPTIYTLTFNTRTLATINNSSDKLLNGSYTITLGNTLSTIVPTTANQNLQDTKYSSSTISISYHTLNPILDTKGAQWTYSSTNPNVYHLGSVGIGTTSPEYSLDVRGNIFTSVGGYTQTGSENWIIQSDRRIKENIVKASYEKCLENVKKIELYNFNFKENYVNTNDRNQLGFIAQEVREVYPKAVIVKPDEKIEELLTVNTTQIKYTLYGAVRSLIEKVERIEERVDKLYKQAIPDVEIKEITSKITEIFESTSNISNETSNMDIV